MTLPASTTAPPRPGRNRVAGRFAGTVGGRFAGTVGGRATVAALAGGLAVRLVLAPFTSWLLDDSVWYKAAGSGARGLGLYSRPGFSYPPLWGHVLQLIGAVLAHLGLPPGQLTRVYPSLAPLAAMATVSDHVTNPWFNLAFKCVLFGFDVAGAFLAASLVRMLTGDERKARRALLVLFLNPLSIWESAVMGDFDTIVGFLVLAAVYLVLANRPLLAGSAVGFGVLAKISPALLAPMLAVAAVQVAAAPFTRGPDKRRAALRALTSYVAGGLLAALVAFSPEILHGGTTAAVSDVFARESTGGSLGGLSIFAVGGFTQLGGLDTTLYGHLGVVHLLVVLVQAVTVAWSVDRVVRRRATPAAVVGTATAVLCVVMLAGPKTEPQYLLWVLPLVVVQCAAWGRRRVALWILTVAPLVYLSSLLGPTAFLGPLAAYQGWPSAASFAGVMSTWEKAADPRLWTPVGHQSLIILVAVTIAATLATVVVRAVIERVPPAGPGSVPGSGPRQAGRRSGGRVVLAGTCALALPSLAMAMITGLPAAGSVSLASSGYGAGGTLSVELRVRPAAGEQIVQVSAFGLYPSTAVRAVDVFYDPAYPPLGTSDAALAGLKGHLVADLGLRGHPLPVTVLGAGALRATLLDPRHAAGTAIVDMAGELPVGVLSGSTDLVTPWVAAGGVLFLGGAPPGLFGGRPGQSVIDAVRDPLPGQAADALLGRGLLLPGPTAEGVGLHATAMGVALGITSRVFSVAVDPVTLADEGGSEIGWGGGGMSSVTTRPVGQGFEVFISGPTYDDDAISSDVAKILLTRAFAVDGAVLTESVPAGALATGTVPLRFDPLASGSGPESSVSVVALDPDEYGTLFGAYVIGPSGRAASS